MKYHPGDRLGKQGILFIQDCGKDKNGKRLGFFECPDCKRKDWVARVSDISSNKSKRCLECKSKFQTGLHNPFSKNLIGKHFGNLVVLGLAEKEKQQKNKNIWKCECQCENKTIVYASTNQLEFKNVTSCGCMRRKDISGQRFGKLTAIKPTSQRSGNLSVVWKCQCDCGNVCYYPLDRLTIGEAVSCGCVHSKGEQKIAQILLDAEIVFDREYCFLDCKNPKTGAKLRFDFYLPDYNCCIEYDGKQHYSYNNNWHYNFEYFKQIKDRDIIKDNYCKQNNIKLVRIPYWEFDKINHDYLLEKILG